MDRVHQARQARDIRAPRTPPVTRPAASLKPSLNLARGRPRSARHAAPARRDHPSPTAERTGQKAANPARQEAPSCTPRRIAPEAVFTRRQSSQPHGVTGRHRRSRRQRCRSRAGPGCRGPGHRIVVRSVTAARGLGSVSHWLRRAAPPGPGRRSPRRAGLLRIGGGRPRSRTGQGHTSSPTAGRAAGPWPGR
jgi:hypothetical protein